MSECQGMGGIKTDTNPLSKTRLVSYFRKLFRLATKAVTASSHILKAKQWSIRHFVSNALQGFRNPINSRITIAVSR